MWRTGSSGAWAYPGHVAARCLAPGARLAAKAQPADDRAVARVLCAHQVRKQATPLPHEFEEAAPRLVVPGKCLQVLVQLLDALREEGDLDFWRARVAVVDGVPGDDDFLRF